VLPNSAEGEAFDTHALRMVAERPPTGTYSGGKGRENGSSI